MRERDTPNRDSALYYYGLLVERYPRSEYAKEVRPSVEYALAKLNNVEVADSVLLQDLDQELYQRAKAGEQNVMEQMINNNANALQVNGLDGINLPNIPGVSPTNGGSVNDLLKGQINKLKGAATDEFRDSTQVPPPPPPRNP